MTEKRFKDIGRYIKNMGFDKNVKFGNHSSVFTTELGDVLIRDYDIVEFPNNPNYYFVNKKSIEDVAFFVIQHYAQLSWPFPIPNQSEHYENISDLPIKCKQYKDRIKTVHGDIRCIPKKEKEELQSSIMHCIIKELNHYSKKFNLEYNGVEFSSRLKGGCDSDNHIIFHTNLFLEDTTYIKYKILTMLCLTQYKKCNFDFWKLLDSCSYQAGITYTTNFIAPELFRTPKGSNKYIKMPLIEDFSQKSFKTEGTIFDSEQNTTRKILL